MCRRTITLTRSWEITGGTEKFTGAAGGGDFSGTNRILLERSAGQCVPPPLVLVQLLLQRQRHPRRGDRDVAPDAVTTRGRESTAEQPCSLAASAPVHVPGRRRPPLSLFLSCCAGSPSFGQCLVTSSWSTSLAAPSSSTLDAAHPRRSRQCWRSGARSSRVPRPPSRVAPRRTRCAGSRCPRGTAGGRPRRGGPRRSAHDGPMCSSQRSAHTARPGSPSWGSTSEAPRPGGQRGPREAAGRGWSSSISEGGLGAAVCEHQVARVSSAITDVNAFFTPPESETGLVDKREHPMQHAVKTLRAAAGRRGPGRRRPLGVAKAPCSFDRSWRMASTRSSPSDPRGVASPDGTDLGAGANDQPPQVGLLG